MTGIGLSAPLGGSDNLGRLAEVAPNLRRVWVNTPTGPHQLKKGQVFQREKEGNVWKPYSRSANRYYTAEDAGYGLRERWDDELVSLLD
mgnify:CR=1 FL=1|jgi:hypothetical protein